VLCSWFLVLCAVFLVFFANRFIGVLTVKDRLDSSGMAFFGFCGLSGFCSFCGYLTLINRLFLSHNSG